MAVQVDRLVLDVDNFGFHANFEIGERRDVPKMSTQGEGSSTTFTSSPACTFESVRSSFMLPHPSTIALSISLIAVPYDFLQRLVKGQDTTTTNFENVEFELI